MKNSTSGKKIQKKSGFNALECPNQLSEKTE